MLFEESNRSPRNPANRRRAPRREPMLLVRARVTEKRAERFQRLGAILVAVLVLAGAAWGLLRGARAMHRALFVENPRFALRTLDARSDGRMTPAQIVEHAGLSGADQLFAVDPRQVWSELAAMPSVRAATVRRRLPDTIEVRVMERTPLARIAVAGAGYTDAVDREGVLLGPRFASPQLPLIEGATEVGLRPGQRLTSPAARAALAALDACDTTRLHQYIRVRRVDVSPADHVTLILENGDRALLPREGLEAKLRRLATILKTIRDQRLPRGPDPLEIDLTTEEVFPVRGLDVEAMAAERPRR